MTKFNFPDPTRPNQENTSSAKEHFDISSPKTKLIKYLANIANESTQNSAMPTDLYTNKLELIKPLIENAYSELKQLAKTTYSKNKYSSIEEYLDEHSVSYNEEEEQVEILKNGTLINRFVFYDESIFIPRDIAKNITHIYCRNSDQLQSLSDIELYKKLESITIMGTPKYTPSLVDIPIDIRNQIIKINSRNLTSREQISEIPKDEILNFEELTHLTVKAQNLNFSINAPKLEHTDLDRISVPEGHNFYISANNIEISNPNIDGRLIVENSKTTKINFLQTNILRNTTIQNTDLLELNNRRISNPIPIIENIEIKNVKKLNVGISFNLDSPAGMYKGRLQKPFREIINLPVEVIQIDDLSLIINDDEVYEYGNFTFAAKKAILHSLYAPQSPIILNCEDLEIHKLTPKFSKAILPITRKLTLSSNLYSTDTFNIKAPKVQELSFDNINNFSLVRVCSILEECHETLEELSITNKFTSSNHEYNHKNPPKNIFLPNLKKLSFFEVVPKIDIPITAPELEYLTIEDSHKKIKTYTGQEAREYLEKMYQNNKE